ncbi:MAG TPA: anthranilate synthase component I, partial [Actinomycetota bacterium]|nr:anthranilate synthase component I [Actinomycetota bacterium]
MTSQYLPSRDKFEDLRKHHNVVPVWTEVIADLETPVSTYMKLVQGADPGSVSFLLESVEHGQRWGRYSFVGVDPFLVLTSYDGEVQIQGELLGDIPEATPLETVRRILESFSVPTMPELPPLIAGGVGFLGYDVVRYLEKLPQTTVADVATPELMLIFARTLFVFDHLRQRLTVVSNVVGEDTYDQAIA